MARETPIVWPCVVPTGTIDPAAEAAAVVLDELDAVAKRLVWECFKRSRPQLATLLRDDATFAALRNEFNARVIVTFAEIQRGRHVDCNA